jgi:hypothetical protein
LLAASTLRLVPAAQNTGDGYRVAQKDTPAGMAVFR